jgi:hypothetical protein
MITLLIATCLTAAMTDCTETDRLPMPVTMTMPDCENVRRLLLDENIGRLVIDAEFKQVTCEQS